MPGWQQGQCEQWWQCIAPHDHIQPGSSPHESRVKELSAGGAALLPTSKNCRTLPSVQCPHSTLAMLTPAAGDMELRLNKARQCQHQRTLLFQNLSRLTTSLYKLTVSKVYWKVGCEIINLNYRSVAAAQKQYLNDKGCWGGISSTYTYSVLLRVCAVLPSH